MKALAEFFSINGELEADGQNREGPLLTGMHRKSIRIRIVSGYGIQTRTTPDWLKLSVK
jgi:hypothetical protein